MMNFNTDLGSERAYGISPSRQLAMSRFVTRTYGWMFAGLLVTGAIAFLISGSQAAVQAVVMNPWIFYGALIAEIGVVLWLTMSFVKLSAAAATFGFLLYSALNGVTFSVAFLVYTMSSIGQVFLITAGMFGGLALFGTVTKKDLTGIGSFMGMGLWGLILVGFANLFFRSSPLNLALSVITVVVFAGLTAWDAQKIRALAYRHSSDGGMSSVAAVEEADKGAIFGALALYLDFINLFWALLRLFGNRRD